MNVRKLPNGEWTIEGFPHGLTFRTSAGATAALSLDIAAAWTSHYTQFGHGIELIIYAKRMNNQPLTADEQSYLDNFKSELTYIP